jgi:uncharacterized protein (TIGR02284 family)
MDNKQIVNVLNDLIETCKDGEYGFRTSAEHVESPQLKALFQRRADECGTAATALQSHVAERGGDVETGGSASGALHRGWVSVKGTLAGYSDLAMLEECERGEDVALEAYRDALNEPLPDPVRAVVQTQYEGVKRNHAQVRTLRDQAKVAH